MGTGDVLREAREKKLLKTAENIRSRVGEAVLTLDDYVTDPRDTEAYIKEVRLRIRFDDEGDVQGIVKREGENGKEIAFHNGDSLAQTLQGLANRMRNGSLKFREDKPYGARNGD